MVITVHSVEPLWPMGLWFYLQAVVGHIYAKHSKVAPIFNPEPKPGPKEDTKQNTSAKKSTAKAEKSKKKDDNLVEWETL